MRMDVRRANINDIDWILNELKKFVAFYGSPRLFNFDIPDHNLEFITNVIDKHLFIIAEQNGSPVGFIAGLIHPHGFNPDLKCLSELFWWIPEEHRTSRAASLLLKSYIEFGRGFDWVTMTIEDKSQLNEKSLLKRGFKLKEKTYLMENN